MATWLHRKEESGEIDSILIDAKYVNDHIEAGYSVDPSGVTAPTFEEADANGTGKLSSDEVRDAAKLAEIEGWETKRINTLKRELGYDDKD